ncbi:GNAT family N-acetyltransferase [Pontiella agarivorans]|uniref:GNAT family N-acetyltransferase n=1 Tax=Pontiella agarivorans TaxID=3038953 RepID=A0ABU5MZQ6_9BACT|nr:GNAT family N-acetyltransferase [Pontiella agarivorans]MDZ8119668.1 GNAT family N-acetyltransferase [Pontiella agarivorans]
MKIRTATEDDIPVMAELLHELFAIEVDFSPDFAVQTKGLLLLLERSDAEIFLAEFDGHVVGMCSIQTHISTAKGCEVGVVEDVVVDLNYRGRGIGAALLRRLEEWSVKRGLARLQLLADRDNNPALGFYRRQGWHSTNLISWMKHL